VTEGDTGATEQPMTVEVDGHQLFLPAVGHPLRVILPFTRNFVTGCEAQSPSSG
jgi:hypothetical protein